MLTPAKLGTQRITHAKMIRITGREPWVLPEPNRKPPAPMATELLKSMSQRNAAKELGISRRQLAKIVEAEAQAAEDDNPFTAEAFLPLPRATAIDLIAEKACRPQGAKWTDYEAIIAGLYGFTTIITKDGKEERKLSGSEQQRTDLRKAVKKKHPTALFVPDWIDPDRAESQRRAILSEVIELTDRISEAYLRLAQQFPGGDSKAIQTQLFNLINFRMPGVGFNWEHSDAERATQLSNRVGDAGPANRNDNTPPLRDPVLDSLCA